jgi:hypothetical protein
MYARVTNFEVDVARLPELKAKIDQMMQLARALPGLVSANVMWRADGRGVVVAIYESQEHATAAVARIQAVWGALAALLKSAPKTDIYDQVERLTP